jgi:DNA-binding response OmpR family regulator
MMVMPRRRHAPAKSLSGRGAGAEQSAVPTILVADDDADHRELLTIALHRYGHEVVAVADAAGALRVVREGGVDAVLLDVRMPGESGIELCERLRAEPGAVGLPILLVSADVGGARVASGLAAGADDYVTKPYHRADLVARLESVLLRRSSVAQRAVTAAMLASRAAGVTRAAGAVAAPAEPALLSA